MKILYFSFLSYVRQLLSVGAAKLCELLPTLIQQLAVVVCYFHKNAANLINIRYGLMDYNISITTCYQYDVRAKTDCSVC